MSCDKRCQEKTDKNFGILIILDKCRTCPGRFNRVVSYSIKVMGTIINFDEFAKEILKKLEDLKKKNDY